MILKILFVADIVGKPGLDVTEQFLPSLKQKHKIDFCIANGENLHEGKGLNEVMLKHLYKAGADVITGGNHSFDKHLIFPYMKHDNNLLRPLNYPKGTPGFGYGIYELKDAKKKIAVLNLQGRTYMPMIDCPFRTSDWIVPKIQEETNLILVDMHAEATAEKIVMAWYLDGKVSAVIGTHTHVITADEQIFPKGTGYITDVGFTGAYDSVIGLDTQTAINRFLYQTPQKHTLAENGKRICCALIHVDEESGKTLKIERIIFPDFRRE